MEDSNMLKFSGGIICIRKTFLPIEFDCNYLIILYTKFNFEILIIFEIFTVKMF